MASAEEPSGTVLHRLIQEQLRYGNPTDARTLLAIQQQALRGGGGGGPGSGGDASGSARSSLESLSPEEPHYPQMSARQEPQGQEHQGDYPHSESTYHLYQLHGEELPSYEQAKAQSQYLALHWAPAESPQATATKQPRLREGVFRQEEEEGEEEEGALMEVKRGHVRSLSERMMRLSLERKSEPAKSSSHSYPELGYYAPQAVATAAGPGMGQDKRSPPPEYSAPIQNQGFIPIHAQEPQCVYRDLPQTLQAQQHRYAMPAEQPEPCYSMFASLPPAGLEEPSQVELLVMENERLKQELEVHREKAGRIQRLEQDYQRIAEAHEALMQDASKRESMHQNLKGRMVAKIRRLEDFNRDLKESLENARTHAAKEGKAAGHNQHMMAKLIEQNEEQNLERQRAERELQRLRVTAEEQGLRAERLEEALEAARGRGRTLEEELRRKRAYVEKVERLQSALAQLQATCEKRESLEMRLRTRLEQELKSLRTQQRGSQPPGVTMGLQQERLREREERILALEADMVRWEQKYLEESTMRQFAMDVAATAAAQRDTTIINHSPCHSSNNSFNEDLPAADHRNQEMENRIRALYAQILEKDAVIKVLQQRLHQDQGRRDGSPGSGPREGSTLRMATSTPSISTAVSATKAEGKSLSDDQTACALRFSAPSSAGLGQQGGAEATQTPVTTKLNTGNAVPQRSPPNPFKGLDDLEAEAVEIFI